MKIDIPKSIKSFRIDVGGSTTAPNASNWMRDLEDCFVIVFDPVYKNITTSSIFMSHVPNFKNTYFIHAAVDNVDEPEAGLMYVTKGNIGCSSLYLPQEHEIDHEEEITKVSLKHVLDQIDWDNVNFDYIEYFKTDTQGNDINVLKSMGEYLDKIVVLEIECTTWDEYYNVPEEGEILSFLESNDFEFLKNCEDSLVNGKYVDRLFINKKFLHLKDEIRTEFEQDNRYITVSLVDGQKQLLDVNSYAIAFGDQMVQHHNVKYDNYYSFGEQRE